MADYHQAYGIVRTRTRTRKLAKRVGPIGLYLLSLRRESIRIRLLSRVNMEVGTLELLHFNVGRLMSTFSKSEPSIVASKLDQRDYSP
jgi:hypothetical protein